MHFPLSLVLPRQLLFVPCAITLLFILLYNQISLPKRKIFPFQDWIIGNDNSIDDRPDNSRRQAPSGKQAVSHIQHSTNSSQISTQTAMLNGTAEGIEEPALVLIFAYMRTGSTFLNEMFNRNPAAFNWFEPLDGLYSALYGTTPGWNAPLNILYYANGSQRILPDFESHLQAYILKNIFTCQFDVLPTEILVHLFLRSFRNQQASLNRYTSCVTSVKLYVCSKCASYVDWICRRSFGKDERIQRLCAAELSQQGSEASIPGWANLRASLVLQEMAAANETERRGFHKTYRRYFQQYSSCMAKCRANVDPCLKHLTKSCRLATLRSIKTIRLKMATAAVLKRSLPQLKILHNIRDPRAVVKSLSVPGFESLTSHYGRGQFLKEAELYCRSALEDVTERRRIEAEFPGCTYQIIYEQLARNPHNITAAMYGFIGRPVHPNVRWWTGQNTNSNYTGPNQRVTSRDSMKTSIQWRKHLTAEMLDAINNVCQLLYGQIEHDWAFTT